jgi:hypothetical protein
MVGSAISVTLLFAAISRLPIYSGAAATPAPGDWLVKSSSRRSGVYRTDRPDEIVLTNGLIRRIFRLAPNCATVGFDNLMTGAAILRGVKPEARLGIDGKMFDVGGLIGQPDYAYLRPDWIDALKAAPDAWTCAGFETGPTVARFAWKRRRYAGNAVWPAPGIALHIRFTPPQPELAGVEATVHYEIYDGLPLICKWITVRNGSGRAIRITAFENEILAAVEAQSVVESPGRWQPQPMYVTTDYAFVGLDPEGAIKTAQWLPDPQYETQINYERQTPCMLVCRPPIGPDAELQPGASFDSFRTFELVYDGTDQERNGLAVRRMYRAMAPWATENPILMHVREADPASVKRAIDQCASVGFEMAILSFGSGFDIEREDAAYRRQIRELVAYAHAKHVELGGYSLLASRRIDDRNDAVNPRTGKPGGAIFGNSPCLGSRWGLDYFRKVKSFIEETGLDLLEHDGSYPGDVCASTTHPGHRGLADSQWAQWKIITDFYAWCRSRDTYLNVPDWYFLAGSNKTAMGYRETNWSLPRDRQIILGRQNLYDGTWTKAPSMGWMFVPLVEYQGGGAAATLEPLREHLDAYGAHLAQNFGSGVQACYRGPRLFDSPQTKAVVKRWVDFYKRHRPILDSDVIHLRRPDARDWDGILHVNPRIKERGLAMLYNPLDRPIRRIVKLPLYYTGLTGSASIAAEDGAAKQYALDPQSRATITVRIPARGLTWLVIE